MTETEWIRLVERARGGDLEAFEDVYEATYPRTYRLAMLLVGEDRADDLVQDAFVLCYRKLPGLGDPARFGPWFRRLVVRLAQRSWGRSGSRPGGRTEVPLEFEVPSDRRSCEEDFERRVTRERVALVLDSLGANHRAVLVLFYFEGLTIPQIAQTLATSQGTVKSRLFHAKAKMRRGLGEPAPSQKPQEDRHDDIQLS